MVFETILYARLELSPDATQDDIKRSYRKSALKWHPDRNNHPHAAERFKACSQAYEILSDPKKREIYDALGLEAFLRGATLDNQSIHTEVEEQTFTTQRQRRRRRTDLDEEFYSSSGQSTRSGSGFTFKASWSFSIGGSVDSNAATYQSRGSNNLFQSVWGNSNDNGGGVAININETVNSIFEGLRGSIFAGANTVREASDAIRPAQISSTGQNSSRRRTPRNE